MSELHSRMFISQSTLEAWLDSGNADVAHDVVELRNLGRSYALTPAVRFVQLVAGSTDGGLLGKVLMEQRVAELGGELLGESVLFGDTAFEVEAGFIGTLREPN